MMELTVVTIILGLVALTSAQCPGGWINYGSSCYHIGRDLESWSEAMKMCEVHGAYLVAMETDDEYNHVKQIMSNYYLGQEFWTAGSDWSTDGEWVWEPMGTKVTTRHWFLTDPNGGATAECMNMRRALGFQWTDDNCIEKKNYVCEKPAAGGGDGGQSLVGR